MALDDNAVVTASQGFLYRNVVGAPAPTPAELEDLDPETFGCETKSVKVTGAPVSVTLTVADVAVATLPLAASLAEIQTAIEAVPAVGAGNAEVTGVSFSDAAGISITWIGKQAGKSLTLTAEAVGGTGTPSATVDVVKALNGWRNIGHTSRDDMPEFAFDGGDSEVKGTWQKKRLKEEATGDPVADSVTVHLEQWDEDSLELYYGEKAADSPSGVFGVTGDFNPIEVAFLVIIVDGTVRLGFYAPKASVKRDDSIDLPVDGFSSLPVKATFLNLGKRRLYDWISEKLFG